MSAICRNRALCLVVSVFNKCTMARNSMADMVIEASDVGGAAGGTGDVARGSVEVALGIDSAAGACGTYSTGNSSYCSTCGDTRDASLGSVATGVEWPTNCVRSRRGSVR